MKSIFSVALTSVLVLYACPAAAQHTVQYLIVAGGGAGGSANGGGGGGGGGFRAGSTTVAPGNYAVVVGVGGVHAGSNMSGGNGGNSSFNGVVSTGGGGGGGWAHDGRLGGSGGGGGSWENHSTEAGSGTAGQGNSGGSVPLNGAGGGGGGAGGAGSPAITPGSGGNGGGGLVSSISGSSVLYAGGGGGGAWGGSGFQPGAAGSGGGGAGVKTANGGNGYPGTPNSGGGGGGGGGSSLGLGGDGGSGIVIIRYPIGAVTATGGAITTVAGYKIHTFTSSGTFSISAAPTLTSVAPNSGNQGANVSVTLTGTNFVSSGTTVAVSGDGVTVSGVSVASPTSLTATFAVGWSAAIGTRNVTVTTASGTSGAQAFTVGAQPSPAGWLAKQDGSGNLYPSGVYEIGGNVGVGTQAPIRKLHVAGDLQVDGNIAARYQDIAEWVDAIDTLPAGTVVVIDQHANRVTPTRMPYDTAVIGVVSASPGVVLGEPAPGRVLVAQSGRVRTKVDARYGAVHRGDLLVTSPNPGHAMRSTPLAIGDTTLHRPGTLIGKALEELTNGTGEILVLLTLQ